MPGRIKQEDIALVREKSPIADVIGEQVQLRNAGGGNLKGLCPFHDEKSPSFSVSPGRGVYHCFGCGVGGDVIRFVQETEHLDFVDAVERLAARAGITLRYDDSGAPSKGSANRGQRQRLIEAHTEAAKFYADQLRSDEAKTAREFLQQRGFDEQAALQFGCGFAPSGWDSLTRHLLAKGFSADELALGGLSRTGGRSGLIDRFHRRLLWPIRDVGGEVVGFGARRLFDDDRIEAKYLNTPETPIFKKSHLLYGADLAKRDIARQHRAVVVEGYTDVMACHLAGVATAVASCGTAFGGDHVSLLRRLLMDSAAFTGEVIFTFDGDAAGMKAAERAFADDQKFMAQTFVAIEPNGLDPCELRQKSGDVAVRDLVAGRIPLVEFVLRSTVARHNLDTAEGTTAALRQAVPLVAQIKDHSLRDEYARRLGGLIGSADPNQVVQAVRQYGRSPSSREAPARRPAQQTVDDATRKVEREVLKVALQLPAVAGPQFDAIPPEGFLLPAHRQIAEAIAATGGAADGTGGPQWLSDVEQAVADERVRSGVNALAVEPLHTDPENEARYAHIVVVRMQEILTSRQVATLKSKLQRVNPLDEPDEHARLFGELISLEAHHRLLREQAIGG